MADSLQLGRSRLVLLSPVRWYSGVLCLLLLSCSYTVQAQVTSSSALVTSATGRVSIERGAELWAVSGGQSLEIGQVMITGIDGFAELDLPDGSHLEIFPNSRFAYRAIRFSLRDVIDLYLGKIRFHIQKLTKDDPSIRVTSPTAVISVRGTTFDVDVDPSESTRVSVEEGAVAVRHRLVPGQEILVRGGESVNVIAGVPLADAKPGVPRTIIGNVVRSVGNTLAQIKGQRGASGGGTASGGGASNSGGVSGSDSGSNESAPPPSGGSSDDENQGSGPPGDRLP